MISDIRFEHFKLFESLLKLYCYIHRVEGVPGIHYLKGIIINNNWIIELEKI